MKKLLQSYSTPIQEKFIDYLTPCIIKSFTNEKCLTFQFQNLPGPDSSNPISDKTTTLQWNDGTFLINTFGPNHLVPVINGDTCLEMKLKDFLNEEHEDQHLYLKDFHAVRDSLTIRNDLQLYSVPSFFRDDWLNGFYDALSVSSLFMDDFRFIYIGREGTCTKLHYDVFSSHSWSMNMSGCKLWLFCQEKDAKQYYDVFGNLRLTSFLSEEDIHTLQILYNDITEKSIDEYNLTGPISRLTHELSFCIQHPGDVVFVPSTWHHEVLNLGPGWISSVNQNWIEATGLEKMHTFINKELYEIRKRTSENSQTSLYDHTFELHCQQLLSLQTGGFNLILFGKFLLFKADQVIQHSTQASLDIKELFDNGNTFVAPHLKPSQSSLLKSSLELIKALELLALDPFIINQTNQNIQEKITCTRAIEPRNYAIEYLTKIHEELCIPKVRTSFTRDDLLQSALALKFTIQSLTTDK